MKKIFFAFVMLLTVTGVNAQTPEDYDFLYKKTGIEANLELGINYTFGNKEWSGSEKSGDILAGVGYNLNSEWYFGVETGYLIKVGKNIEWVESNEPGASGTEEWKDAHIVPVMGDIRYCINTHHSWNPFIEVRAGYGFLAKKNGGSKDYVIVDPRIGLKFRLNEGLDVRLAAGYMGLWGKQGNTYKNLDGITVQAGIGVRF